jgi:hypothetical protein
MELLDSKSSISRAEMRRREKDYECSAFYG